MIILKETIESQTIKFIPRDYSANILVLRNETNNSYVILKPDFIVDGYYLKCDLVLDLKENTFYNLTIFNSEGNLFNEFKARILFNNGILESEQCLKELLEELSFLSFTADNNIITADSEILTADADRFEKINVVVYRDKIFCTNQNKDNYTVNENQYVANVTNNEFKIYE